MDVLQGAYPTAMTQQNCACQHGRLGQTSTQAVMTGQDCPCHQQHPERRGPAPNSAPS
jgi:hypothetical protein